MIHSSTPYDHRSQSEGYMPKAGKTIATEKIEVEYKTFFLDLQENQRGRFLRITEDAGGRREAIIVPIENAAEFTAAVRRVITAVP